MALAQQTLLEREHQLAQQLELQKAEKLAYNALARREYSTQELEEKLLRKNTPVDIVRMVLRQMQDLDLQSDDRFTENFVRSRIHRGQGPVRIEMELKQRGISMDLAEQHLAAEEGFWLAQAKTLLTRRGIGQPRSKTDSDATEWPVGDLAADIAPTTFTQLEQEQALERGSARDGEPEWMADQQWQKLRASHARFLASRGFRSNTIEKALTDTFD